MIYWLHCFCIRSCLSLEFLDEYIPSCQHCLSLKYCYKHDRQNKTSQHPKSGIISHKITVGYHSTVEARTQCALLSRVGGNPEICHKTHYTFHKPKPH